MLKHTTDFTEEVDQLIEQITIDSGLNVGLITTKARLRLLSNLHDKWMDGYNQGFLDSRKENRNA